MRSGIISLMCWHIYLLDRCLGTLEVLPVLSDLEAWDAFMSQSRLARIVDSSRYKAWLEGSTSLPVLEHQRHFTFPSSR